MDAAKCLLASLTRCSPRRTTSDKNEKKESIVAVAETTRRRQRGSGGVGAGAGGRGSEERRRLGRFQLNAPTEMSRWPFAN